MVSEGFQVNHERELIEFYRQLELLADSRLPLPEGIAGVAENCRSPRLRGVLRDLARDVAEGQPLGSALRRHPHAFPEVYASLLEGGERAGVLRESLHEVSSLAQRMARAGMSLREALVYPAITVAFALGTVLVMLRYYMPQLAADLAVYYEGPLPSGSALIYGLADLVCALWPVPALAYGALLASTIWLLSDSGQATRCLARLVRFAPGATRLSLHLDNARVCALLAVFMRRGVPTAEMLRACSAMLERPGAGAKLRQFADACEKGRLLAELEDLDAVLGPNTALALRHVSEDRLPTQLERLAESERIQADIALQRLRVLANVCAIGGMAVVGALSILGLFVPLIELYGRMAELGA